MVDEDEDIVHPYRQYQKRDHFGYDEGRLDPKETAQAHRDDEAENYHGHSAETQQEPSMYKEEISYRQEPTQRETHIQKHDGVTQDHRGDIRYAFPG